MSLSSELDAIAAETDFSGVVAVSRPGTQLVRTAYGHANRALDVPNTTETQFCTASGSKGLTALGVGSLIHNGSVAFDTTARELLGDLLPDVDPAVTVRHLLGHTSGVGDYVDEDILDDVNDYVLDVPVHRLSCPAEYVRLLVGHPQKFPPGARFSYSNSGYVILSLIIEAVSGDSFYNVVQSQVLDRAGMSHTGFYRSDELPGSAAIGYLTPGESCRSNVFHLPVRGAGDGGAHSTCSDVEAFWDALFAGRILPLDLVETLVTEHSRVANGGLAYGYGFWLRPDRTTVMLEGSDAGASFRSAYHRPTSVTYTVLSNTSSGAWPVVRYLDERLPALVHAIPS